MASDTGDELERIVAAYRQRDSVPAMGGTLRHADPAYVSHLHELEWQVVVALQASGVVLEESRLLDTGTGSGAFLQRLRQLGARHPVGIELVPERVEQAHRDYPELDVRCSSATGIPFDDDTFDVVTHFMCLSSVLDAGTRREIAAEMWRVLAPGGVVLSYDLRPSPRVLRAGRRLLGPGDSRTPVKPLALADLELLWGRPERVRSVQLNLDLARLVGGRRAIVAALRACPPLRSHLLAMFRKPA
ncbi:MAG TPA: class I SAM-dependent methyltransferase [Baekduia sp.]|nr:class I SAM-dependent methyltransferase [Baekduia sp.]